MNRKRKLRLELLRIIVATDDQGFSTAEDILFRDVRGIHPAPGVAEIRDLIREMDREQLVVVVPDEDLARLSPTARGRAVFLKDSQGI